MNSTIELTTMNINITTTSERDEDTEVNNTTKYPDTTDNTSFNVDTMGIMMGGVVVAMLVAYLYNYVASKRQNKVYDNLNMKHIVMSILHGALWELPEYTKDERLACNSLRSELLCTLELAIPFWTLCISLKMFSDLYLFTSGDVFTVKDMTLFTCSSVIVMNIYELLFIFLTNNDGDDLNFSSAVRLTSVLLITCVPVTVFCIIIRSFCTKSDIVKPLGLFFLLHLLVFIFCDVCLALFLIAKTTHQSKSFENACSMLFDCRLLVEISWYVGSHFLGKKLRIFNNEN